MDEVASEEPSDCYFTRLRKDQQAEGSTALFSGNESTWEGWGYGSVMECLPSMYEVLGSTPVPTSHSPPHHTQSLWELRTLFSFFTVTTWRENLRELNGMKIEKISS